MKTLHMDMFKGQTLAPNGLFDETMAVTKLMRPLLLVFCRAFEHFMYVEKNRSYEASSTHTHTDTQNNRIVCVILRAHTHTHFSLSCSKNRHNLANLATALNLLRNILMENG